MSCVNVFFRDCNTFILSSKVVIDCSFGCGIIVGIGNDKHGLDLINVILYILSCGMMLRISVFLFLYLLSILSDSLSNSKGYAIILFFKVLSYM